MRSIWRRHLIICLFLGFLAVPIYFLDLASTGGGSGNWITLDFRGLIFWTYITLLAVHVALSSIGVVLFPKLGALRIHFCSMLLSVILLVMGFFAYGKLLRAHSTQFYGNWRAKVPNILREKRESFRFLNAE
jgi:hypothetical protein